MRSAFEVSHSVSNHRSFRRPRLNPGCSAARTLRMHPTFLFASLTTTHCERSPIVLIAPHALSGIVPSSSAIVLQHCVEQVIAALKNPAIQMSEGLLSNSNPTSQSHTTIALRKAFHFVDFHELPEAFEWLGWKRDLGSLGNSLSLQLMLSACRPVI